MESMIGQESDMNTIDFASTTSSVPVAGSPPNKADALSIAKAKLAKLNASTAGEKIVDFNNSSMNTRGNTLSLIRPIQMLSNLASLHSKWIQLHLGEGLPAEIPDTESLSCV